MAIHVFRGQFTIMPCCHCGKKLEAGQKWLAKWKWCVLCQAPACWRASCTKRCNQHANGANMDLRRYEGWVMEMTGMNLDRPEKEP